MQTSVFLAKLIGPFALLLGLAMLINRARFQTLSKEFLDCPALIFLSGVITFPAGLAIVLTHNVWVADWPVIITIIGWLTAISGAFRLVAPEGTVRFGRRAYERPNGVLFGGLFWVVLGAILCFFGYVK